jgi:hypothetical protein
MGRTDLINELVDFIEKHTLFSQPECLSEARERIGRQLENIDFVERLIGLLIIKARYLKNVDIVQLNKILSGLEEIRLELEYE